MAMQIPNKMPSSTAQFAGVGGAIAAILFGLMAIFLPEYYLRVPAGMEAGVAGLVAFLFAWSKKENTYRMVDPKQYSIVPNTAVNKTGA